MAYTKYDPTVPDGITQTGPEITPSVRDNQTAIGDGIIMGSLVDWDMNVTIGPLETPAEITYDSLDNPNDKLRVEITWDDDDNPLTMAYYRAYDGTTYELIGTKTIAWSVDGAVISMNWS